MQLRRQRSVGTCTLHPGQNSEPGLVFSNLGSAIVKEFEILNTTELRAAPYGTELDMILVLGVGRESASTATGASLLPSGDAD